MNGESWSKKHERVTFWRDALGMRKLSKARLGKTLIPASVNDLRLLKALTFPNSSIVVADTDNEKAFEVHEWFPEIKVLCSKPSKVVKEYRKQFDFILLDYDRPLDAEMLVDVHECLLHGSRSLGGLAVRFKLGREKSEYWNCIEKEIELIHRVNSVISKPGESAEKIALYDLMYVSRFLGVEPQIFGPDDIRFSDDATILTPSIQKVQKEYNTLLRNADEVAECNTLALLLLRQSMEQCVAVKPYSYFHYWEGDETYCLLLLEVFRTMTVMPLKKFRQQFMTHTLNRKGSVVHDCNIDETLFAANVMELINDGTLPENKEYRRRESTAIFVPLPEMLNVSAEKINEWIATSKTKENQ